MNRLQRRQYLIKELFKIVFKETIGDNPRIPIKFDITNGNSPASSYCKLCKDRQGKLSYILIVLDLKGIKYITEYGYSASYYNTRPARLNKYILKNRHNALRFILYHEARHAWQRINKDVDIWDDIERREYDADSWALAHLNITKQKNIQKVFCFIK